MCIYGMSKQAAEHVSQKTCEYKTVGVECYLKHEPVGQASYKLALLF